VTSKYYSSLCRIDIYLVPHALFELVTNRQRIRARISTQKDNVRRWYDRGIGAESTVLLFLSATSPITLGACSQGLQLTLDLQERYADSRDVHCFCLVGASSVGVKQQESFNVNFQPCKNVSLLPSRPPCRNLNNCHKQGCCMCILR